METDPGLGDAMDQYIIYSATQPSEKRLAMLRAISANPEADVEHAMPALGFDPVYLPYIHHIANLAAILDAGCTMRPEDLPMEDWLAIARWRGAQARFRDEWTSCPQCSAAMKRSQSFCGSCGWNPKA